MKIILTPEDYGNSFDYMKFESVVYTLAMNYDVKSARINTIDDVAGKVLQDLGIPTTNDVSLHCCVLSVGQRKDESLATTLRRALRMGLVHARLRREWKCKK